MNPKDGAFTMLVQQLQGTSSGQQMPEAVGLVYRRVHFLTASDQAAGAEANRRRAKESRVFWEQAAVAALAEDPGLLIPEVVGAAHRASDEKGPRKLGKGGPYSRKAIYDHLVKLEPELRRRAAQVAKKGAP